MRFVKQNTAFTHVMGPFVSSTDGVTPVATITPVTTDWRIAKNGGTFLQKSSATTTVYLERGYYQVGFSSTDVDTIGHLQASISLTSAGGALSVWDEFWVSESSEFAVALTSAARSTAIDLIWDEPTTGHGTVGTAGASVAFPTSSVSMLAASQTALVTAVTTAVWAETYVSHTTAGTYGLVLGTNLLTPTSGVIISAASLASITTGIWAEALASHTTAGGAGKKLSDLAMSTDMGSVLTGVNIATTSIPAITTAIWAEALAGHTTAGGAGKKLSDLAMSTDMVSVLTASNAIQAKTTNLPATPASSTDAMRLLSTAIDLIWDEEIVAAHATTNTAGERLAAAGNAGAAADPWATATTNAAYTSTQFGGRLDALISSRMPSTGSTSLQVSSDLVDLIWDEPTTAHGTTNTMGERLFTAAGAAAASDPWGISTTGVTYTSTQFGGRLDALISSRATSTDLMRLSSTAIDLIWDELTTGHGTVGTAGASIAFPTSSVGISTTGIQSITTAVWAEAYAGHTTAGTYGAIVGANLISPTSGVTMLAASQTALVTAVTTGVWAEALLSHTTAGGAGKKLSDLAMSTDMASVLTGVNIATTSIPAITTAIWAEALASHTTAGGAGKKLSDITATTVPDAWGVALPGAYTTAQAGGIVSAIRTASSQIELATTTLPLEPAGSSNFTALMTSTGSTAMADAVWARNSEATESYGGQIRLIRAASAGVSTGGGTPAISFFSPTTTITRIAATVTTDGNRTAVAVTT